MLEKRLLLDRVGDEKLEIVPEVEAGGALSEDLAETCARAQNHLNYAVEKGKHAGPRPPSYFNTSNAFSSSVAAPELILRYFNQNYKDCLLRNSLKMIWI